MNTSQMNQVYKKNRINEFIKKHKLIKNYQLYLFILPTLLYVAIFNYLPMYGIIIAFKDFFPPLGFIGSPWVGFQHFERFFSSPVFWTVLKNTLGLSIYSLIAGFPIPIILALALNYCPNPRFKKIVQTVTYAPHFISTVVIVGMLYVFLSPRVGIVNNIIAALGGEQVFFMAKPEFFKSIFVWSSVWTNAGWASIIYIAALSGIDLSLHESARVDGASILQRIRYVDIPGILPTIVILLILRMGQIMSVGFEKAYLMQNPLNSATSEIISTYVYKIGIVGGQFSYSAAVGLFNSVVNLILLVSVNKLAKKYGETSLW